MSCCDADSFQFFFDDFTFGEILIEKIFKCHEIKFL